MATEMDQDEIDTRLLESGVGVLSLTDGNETYAVPESFGYDPDRETLYFQFVNDEDSHKMKFVDTTEVATFTVFTEDPAESVVVRGKLERISDSQQTTAAAIIAENAHIPTLNVYPDRTPDELSMAFYQLTPISISGRKFHSMAPEPADS